MSYSIKVGDLEPPLAVQLVDKLGVGIDLDAGPSVVNLRLKFPDNSIVDFPAITLGVDTERTSLLGWVQYSWQAGNTDTEGDYEAEFIEVVTARPRTFPSSTVVHFRIYPILADEEDPLTVTWGDILALNPDACNINTPVQNLILNYVNNCLDVTGFDKLSLKLARLYLAAHHVHMGLASGAFVRGPVTSLSAGGISKSYASVVTASDSSLDESSHGRAYRYLVRTSAHRAPCIV